jgi:hypothetical protein
VLSFKERSFLEGVIRKATSPHSDTYLPIVEYPGSTGPIAKDERSSAITGSFIQLFHTYHLGTVRIGSLNKIKVR